MLLVLLALSMPTKNNKNKQAPGLFYVPNNTISSVALALALTLSLSSIRMHTLPPEFLSCTFYFLLFEPLVMYVVLLLFVAGFISSVWPWRNLETCAERIIQKGKGVMGGASTQRRVYVSESVCKSLSNVYCWLKKAIAKIHNSQPTTINRHWFWRQLDDVAVSVHLQWLTAYLGL